MANKMTKRDYYNELKGIVADRADLVAFIDHELELLDKKNKGEKKPSKAQIENEAIKETIFNALETGKDYRVNDVISVATPNLSNQKVSALLTKLVKEGKLSRKVDKKVPYFTKA